MNFQAQLIFFPSVTTARSEKYCHELLTYMAKEGETLEIWSEEKFSKVQREFFPPDMKNVLLSKYDDK